MRAIGYRSLKDAPDTRGLVAFDAPCPQPGPQDLLVRVEAIALNPVDLKMLARQPEEADPPVILGWDAAGVVEAVGSEVRDFAPGDRVWYAGAVNRPGCWQAWQCVDHRLVGHMPRVLDFVQAAAMPLTGLTAWEALFERLRLDPTGGDRGRPVLLLGASGGVGSMAIQLAKWAGLEPVATSAREDGRAWCRRMGAGRVLDHSGDLVRQWEETGLPRPAEVFCITRAAQHGEALAELLAPQGGVCFIDDFPGEAAIAAFKRKSAALVWEFMFTRSLYQTEDMAEQGRILARIAALVDDGVLISTLGEHLGTLSPETLNLGLDRLAAGGVNGKLVLDLAGWHEEA